MITTSFPFDYLKNCVIIQGFPICCNYISTNANVYKIHQQCNMVGRTVNFIKYWNFVNNFDVEIAMAGVIESVHENNNSTIIKFDNTSLTSEIYNLTAITIHNEGDLTYSTGSDGLVPLFSSEYKDCIYLKFDYEITIVTSGSIQNIYLETALWDGGNGWVYNSLLSSSINTSNPLKGSVSTICVGPSACHAYLYINAKTSQPRTIHLTIKNLRYTDCNDNQYNSNSKVIYPYVNSYGYAVIFI